MKKMPPVDYHPNTDAHKRSAEETTLTLEKIRVFKNFIRQLEKEVEARMEGGIYAGCRLDPDWSSQLCRETHEIICSIERANAMLQVHGVPPPRTRRTRRSRAD